MISKLICIPEHLINSIISAVAILMGAIVGGMFTWRISTANTNKNIQVQSKIAEENMLCMKREKLNLISESANLIQLDICTALFQSIRGVLSVNSNSNIFPIPINKNYSKSIVALKNEFDLKELSYLYQLYGIMEKLNKDMMDINIDDNKIKEDYNMFLKKLYGDNVSKVLDIDIDKVGYTELYDNDIIKSGYKDVLNKLNHICCKDFGNAS